MFDRASLVWASILFPVFLTVGLLAMRTPPDDPPAVAEVRFARVDLPTILRRAGFNNTSIERQKESLARFGPKIDACEDEFRRVVEEADADPEEKARPTYSQPYIERFRDIHRRVLEIRESFQSELESIVDEHEAEAKSVAERAIAEIAGREGYTAVFTMPFAEGNNRWDPVQTTFAPVAWCGSCVDLTLEVAEAIGLPRDAFDIDSEYWRYRSEVLGEVFSYLEPRPWEPEE